MCTVWAALFLFLSPFSFRYRFAALLRTPSPHTHPSLLSICPFPRLSTAFPFSFLSLFNAPRVVTLVLSRLSVFVCPSPARHVPFLLLSLRLSRSRFFSCFFHRPPLLLPIFPLPYAPSTVLLPFVYYHRLLSFNPFLPRRVLSSTLFRPSLHTPAASVETARFFPPVSSAPTFFTPFFSPSPPFLRRLPMRRSPPRHRNIASSIRSVSLSPVSHIRTWSFSPSWSRLSSALFLLSFVHLSLPSRLSFIFPCLSPPLLSLSFTSPPLPPPAAPIFLIFFSQLPDHLPTPRVGVLFLSGRSSRPSARPRTRVHTYALAACASGRDEEIKKGVKRELVDVGGKGGPTGAREKGG